MDLEGESLRFQLWGKVEPGSDSDGSYDYDLFLFALVDFTLVSRHEEVNQNDMAPVYNQIHPILIALKLKLTDFNVQIVFAQQLLKRSLEFVTGLYADASEFRASGLQWYRLGHGLSSRTDGANRSDWLLVGVN